MPFARTSDLPPVITVERLLELHGADLHDLCDAADAAIADGGGFGWLRPPHRTAMERYWQGALVVPGRSVYIGRMDGVIAASTQLARPAGNNEARAGAAYLTTCFVAPWARGHGLARRLMEAVEVEASDDGFETLQLDVRASQTAAIRLYESLGYVCWGTNPYYAKVDGVQVAGRYYYKIL